MAAIMMGARGGSKDLIKVLLEQSDINLELQIASNSKSYIFFFLLKWYSTVWLKCLHFYVMIIPIDFEP